MSYWPRFGLLLLLGLLVGLLLGSMLEVLMHVEGWDVMGAAAGGVVGLLIHMWRT